MADFQTSDLCLRCLRLNSEHSHENCYLSCSNCENKTTRVFYIGVENTKKYKESYHSPEEFIKIVQQHPFPCEPLPVVSQENLLGTYVLWSGVHTFCDSCTIDDITNYCSCCKNKATRVYYTGVPNTKKYKDAYYSFEEFIKLVQEYPSFNEHFPVVSQEDLLGAYMVRVGALAYCDSCGCEKSSNVEEDSDMDI